MNCQFRHENIIVFAIQSTTAVRIGLDVTLKTAKGSGFITNVLVLTDLQRDAGIVHHVKNQKARKGNTKKNRTYHSFKLLFTWKFQY